jgi:hypothetical protein
MKNTLYKQLNMNIGICSLNTAVKLLPEYFEFQRGTLSPSWMGLMLDRDSVRQKSFVLRKININLTKIKKKKLS